MRVNISYYPNRKMYARKDDNIALKGTPIEKYLGFGRYVSGKELKYLISELNVKIKVRNKKTGEDITRRILLNLLDANLFTEKDLYSLVREQSQCRSVLNKYESERAFSRNGIEL